MTGGEGVAVRWDAMGFGGLRDREVRCVSVGQFGVGFMVFFLLGFHVYGESGLGNWGSALLGAVVFGEWIFGLGRRLISWC